MNKYNIYSFCFDFFFFQNDSGVDVSNTRLPDPPTHTNQVYSFMQKIKSFGSLSKSLTKLTKKKSLSSVLSPTTSVLRDDIVPKQQYENHRFYVPCEYQNVPETTTISSKSKSSTKIQSNKSMTKKKDTPSDPYENQEFHSPRPSHSISVANTHQSIIDNASSPVLNHYNDKNAPTQSILTATEQTLLSRKKSKTGKSFKSKFRKSLGPDTKINLGSSFNGNRSTFYISDSVDVDSGIFTTSSDKTLSTSDDQINLTVTSPATLSTATTTTSTSNSVAPLYEIDKNSSTNSITTPVILTVPDISRRKSSLGVRPNNPPPPPPVDNKRTYKTKRLGTTSWYAECGVFKAGTLNKTDTIDNNIVVDQIGEKPNRKEIKSNSSWYADAGLYQTSGESVASSSGSSGVSTGGECGPGDDTSHSMFLNEPLYQIYSAAKLEVIFLFLFNVKVIEKKKKQ